MADDGGLARYQRRLMAIPESVRKALAPALMVEANKIADTMEQLAPEDEGDLKASIAVTGAGRSTPAYSQPGGSLVVPELAAAITVGDADTRYPHVIEHGSTKMNAQPFFWPAVRLHRKSSTKAIKSAVRRAVRKHWGKA